MIPREGYSIANETREEKASIDEAFLDLTGPVREKLLERFSYLGRVPADAPEGLDSPLPPAPPIDWGQVGELVPIIPPVGSEADELKTESDHLTTWHDIALSIGAELMSYVRDEVQKQLGYTTSAVCISLGNGNSASFNVLK